MIKQHHLVRVTLSVVLVGVVGCGAGQEASTPNRVVQTLFDAAQSEQFESLQGLCDPQSTDGDVQRICAVPEGDAALQQEFIESFSKGKINGEATIEGEQATVPILLGPEGNDEEEMALVKREEQWYLSGF